MNPLEQELIGWRRHFHRNPELSGQEKNTQAFIEDLLKQWQIPFTPFQRGGLQAFIGQGKTTLGLRADMDALPIEDGKNTSYRSAHPGVCHACGHDGHMAILLGTAKALKAQENTLNQRIKLIFQPSEESAPGGADQLVKEGVMDDVDAIFGFHLWQDIPTGTVAIAPDRAMAAADSFRITITGQGGHGSAPQQTQDPIVAAAQLIQASQTIVSRNLDPLEAGVISICTIHGGSKANIIPSQIELTGTIRSYRPEVRALLHRRLEELTSHISEAFGCQGRFTLVDSVPPVLQSSPLVEKVRQTFLDQFGREAVQSMAPKMGGEDFAFYLTQKPGVYFGVGAGGSAYPFPHHHPRFDFDERALAFGLQALLAIAQNLTLETEDHP